MNYLVIGVLVIIFVIYVIGGILKVLADIANEIGEAFVNFAGRKNKNHKATIPDELLPDIDPLPNSKSQLDKLSFYTPKLPPLPAINTYQYDFISDALYGVTDQKINQRVFLPQVTEILSKTPQHPSYKKYSSY